MNGWDGHRGGMGMPPSSSPSSSSSSNSIQLSLGAFKRGSRNTAKSMASIPNNGLCATAFLNVPPRALPSPAPPPPLPSSSSSPSPSSSSAPPAVPPDASRTAPVPPPLPSSPSSTSTSSSSLRRPASVMMAAQREDGHQQAMSDSAVKRPRIDPQHHHQQPHHHHQRHLPPQQFHQLQQQAQPFSTTVTSPSSSSPSSSSAVAGAGRPVCSLSSTAMPSSSSAALPSRPRLTNTQRADGVAAADAPQLGASNAAPSSRAGFSTSSSASGTHPFNSYASVHSSAPSAGGIQACVAKPAFVQTQSSTSVHPVTNTSTQTDGGGSGVMDDDDDDLFFSQIAPDLDALIGTVPAPKEASRPAQLVIPSPVPTPRVAVHPPLSLSGLPVPLSSSLASPASSIGALTMMTASACPVPSAVSAAPMMHIGSFKRNSRFNTGIMTMRTAATADETTETAQSRTSTGGLSLTMNMSGISERSLDVVPERFANLTKEDVPNSFKFFSDFFSMLEEEYNSLPDADPDPSPLESNPELSLTQEQEQVLQMALSGMSLFFTGCAGTGKSLLLTEIVARLRKIHPPGTIYVTASTGIAACQVGGITLHTFAGVGLAKYKAESLVFKVMKDPVAVKRWRKVKVIVIDEISMLAGEFFDKVEYVARKIREDERPFGGIQVVLCGDFLQLPPVMAKYLCFESESWSRVVRKSVELTQVFRQSETEFINLLNEIRVGNVSAQTRAKLENCVRRSIERKKSDEEAQKQKLLVMRKAENAQPQRQYEDEYGEPYDYYDELAEYEEDRRGESKQATEQASGKDIDIPPTQLFPTRREVAQRNQECLAALGGRTYVYKAVDQGKEPFLSKLQKYCPAPETLELKVGAQVILLMNIAFHGGLVNGARGVITGFASDSSEVIAAGRTVAKNKRKPIAMNATYYPIVRFTTGVERIILPEEWKSEVGPKKVASRTQIPLNLAWALSIHKSQGMTLSKVEMNLNQVFAYGQAYVALSRAQNLEGLYLMGFEARKVRAHPRVLEFYRRFSTSSALGRTSSPPSSQLYLPFGGSTRSSAHDRDQRCTAMDDNVTPGQRTESWEDEERQYREVWADEDEVTWE